MAQTIAAPRDWEVVALVVGAICVSGDAVLLVRRSLNDPFLPGRWGIPGGHVRPGERLSAALTRELRKETGLVVDNARLAGTSAYTERWKGGEVSALQLNYLVRCGERRPKINGPRDSRWLSGSELAAAEWIDTFTRNAISQSVPFPWI